MRALATSFALAMVVAACSNASSSPPKSSGPDTSKNATVNQPGVTADTIRVGGVTSITNALNAPYGDLYKGVKAYFAKVNSEGGIYGRKLEVVSERDDLMTQNLKETQGLLTEDNVFAAVGLATIFDFSGATELEKAGIPSFGWNINADWNKPNLFGNAGALCIGCEGVELPWIAKQLKKTSIGVLDLRNRRELEEVRRRDRRSRSTCTPPPRSASRSDAHSFGDTDFSVDVKQMKDAGVDFITTCMDNNAVLALAKETRAQQLDATSTSRTATTRSSWTRTVSSSRTRSSACRSCRSRRRRSQRVWPST